MSSVESRAVRTADADRPDPAYWTAYDHFMVERDARALRRAYTWSLIVRAWRWSRATIAGARGGGGHRRVQGLSPRT